MTTSLMFRRLVIAVMSYTAAVLVYAAPTLMVRDGLLIGAQGVDIGSRRYEVTFVDGTCSAVFYGCEPSHFAFEDHTAALQAAQVLLDQVLIAEWDDAPYRTAGCDYGFWCDIYTPYRTGARSPIYRPGDTLTVYTHNVGHLNPFYIDDIGIATGKAGSFDTARAGAGIVWAYWRHTPVPEPATWALVMLGMGVLAALRRRR